MKLDTHGIRFRFWLVCIGLAFGITLFIGFLQVGLIRPYYSNSKIRAVSTVAEAITEDLILNDSIDGIDDALKQTVDNNVCVIMYNDYDKVVYSADSLGTGCIFNTATLTENEALNTPSALRDTLKVNGGEYSTRLVNAVTGQDMILYGRTVKANLSNYYLFVNSPLEPVDSTVTFFTRQYFFYMIIAIILASIVSLVISEQLTRPIVRMKGQAQKLSEADYSARFEGGSFTETKELAQTLNTASERLSRIDQMRRDLMANVSHDIKTPLTDIRAYAEMIRDISGNNPAKREMHLNVILKETDYMTRLINDMSELSKMQSGSYILHRENVDLQQKISEIIEMHMPLIEKGQLQVKMNIEENLMIFADEIKISQVISNYLSNAIKHSPPNSVITINAFTKKDEETVRIEVIDEGEGIPEEELPYIWDRYQKSSRTFQRSMTNTGLGLAIVKAIAETHGAKCGADTKKNSGSLFWFELRETHED